jgi:hypothetical protein
MINPLLVEVLSPSIANPEPEKPHEISLSCDNNAEAQPATEAALPTGEGANKRSHSSTLKQAKQCSKKQKRAPTAKKGEHALLGGFAIDRLDEDASILKCMLEDKSKLEFDCDPKSISQLEKFPFETSEIPTLDNLLLPGVATCYNSYSEQVTLLTFTRSKFVN